VGPKIIERITGGWLILGGSLDFEVHPETSNHTADNITHTSRFNLLIWFKENDEAATLPQFSWEELLDLRGGLFLS